MIRRPPTAIALEHQDVESHLQRIYLRHTLTVDFEQLRLDDESVGDLQMEYTLSPGVSSDHSDGKIDTTEGQAGPSCIGYTLPQDENASTSATPQIRSATKSCLKSPVPSKCRLSLQGTISPGVHPRRADRLVDPQLKVKFALSPQELELHNGNVHLPPEEIACDPREAITQTGHTDTIGTSMTIDSPDTTPQVSFLSCGISSSPATSVPLRDLALACKMSYEAVLAEGTASPASANNTNLSEDRDSQI